MEDAGWYAAYGGNIRVTGEEHHSGNFSLEMTGRTEAWHSPALNLDRIFYEGGPGIYVFTVWVKVKNVNPYLRKVARSIVRGRELTTFIELHGTNYFHAIASKNTTEDQWTNIQGWISVSSEDIHKGTFSWMLDLLDPYENQAVYIDDFDIFKSSDNPNPNQAQVAVVNDKPYEADVWYLGAGDLKGDEAVAWYYDTMANTDYTKHCELVYTFTETNANSFYYDLVDLAEEELTQHQIEELAGSLEDTAKLLMQTVPILAPLLTAMDILSAIEQVVSPTYQFQWNEIRNLFDNNMIRIQKTTQEMVTISVHLMKHDTSFIDLYQVKFQRSDGVKAVYTIDKPVYEALVALCNVYVNGSTYNRPSVNRVISNYMY